MVQYNSSGTEQWAKSIGGADAESGNDVAADGAGVFITGSYFTKLIIGTDTLISKGNSDVFLAKFTANGTAQWARTGGGIASDGGVALTLDAASNVIIVGNFNEKIYFGSDSVTSSGNSDVFLTKYNASGSFIWLRRGWGRRSRGVGGGGCWC